MIRYIYKITCLKGSFAGHYYIGQHTTDNLEDGYAGSGNKIIRYYNKHGKVEGETYSKEILAFANSQEELNELEKYYISDNYDSDSFCMNLMGGGGCGGKRSKEALKNYSEATKRKWKNPEYRLNHSQKVKGKHRSEEQKLNVKLGMTKYYKEHTVSEFVRQKRSDNMTRKWQDPEFRQKQLQKFKGRPAPNKGKHLRINPETGKREYY